MRKLLFSTIILLGFSVYTSAQSLTDSTIAMIAFWSIGDEAIYEFKEVEDKFSKGEKTLKTTTYDVKMTIVDSTENNYRVRWDYVNYEVDYELAPFEKDLMEICGDIPVEYRTDEMGAFQSIENWTAMKEVADVAFTKWVADKKELPDSTRLQLKNMMLSLFENEAQMNYWLRDVRFFHYMYGGNLNRAEPYEGIKYYTNPFVKKRMDGTQRVEVLEVDEENLIAHIKVNSGIDGDKAKALMIDFYKKNMEKLGIEDESEIEKAAIPNYSVTEEMEYVYDIESGYILRGRHSKLTKLNDDYKLTTYDYNLKSL